MRITYDYSEFLQEFREELYECALSLEDEVLVLRGKPLPDGYRPVIDWYYDEDVMLEWRLFKPREDDEVIGCIHLDHVAEIAYCPFCGEKLPEVDDG
jgi:hypothetical protein